MRRYLIGPVLRTCPSVQGVVGTMVLPTRLSGNPVHLCLAVIAVTGPSVAGAHVRDAAAGDGG
jgi:hypothetical protein